MRGGEEERTERLDGALEAPHLFNSARTVARGSAQAKRGIAEGTREDSCISLVPRAPSLGASRNGR